MTVFLACALTVIIETAFLALRGYRSAFAVTVVVCANIITNLTLNLVIARTGLWGWWLLPLEAAVVAAEYAIFAKAFEPSRQLFWLTLGANALSFFAGIAVFGL